ncbi:ATP-dependent helicase [Candidatus Allofournierella merdipullorum]|uniref:ATP-dependent helicase n=1 Tax=Candidatus Allofournierella merdipullorum TaxID=2838595 RepID=UPI00374E9D37
MTFEEYKKKYQYDTLDSQQCAAVEATDGPVLLLAVPGSGKTTTLIARLGYLVYGKGVNAANILTCTYTVAATNEMRERFRTKFGDEYADQMEFRTINGICARIISLYEKQGHTAFELVADDSRRYAIMREVWMADGHAFPAESDLRMMSTAITYVKNQMLTDDEADSVSFNTSEGNVSIGPIYRSYKQAMRRNQWMDYDDQMVYALTILKKCPAILQQLQTRYQYFCVDEAQDTSKIQHEVIATLASKSRNIMMVGDEDQSIYGFRAACPQALMDFERNWPGAKVLLMEQNYRSTPQIVEAADIFIKQNKTRRDKNMRAHQSAGGEIVIQPCASRLKQYAQLANMAEEANAEQKQTAILYRNNDTALPIIDELNRRGIEYRAKGVDGLFFTSKIVSDVKDFFQLAKNPDDKTAFLHLYYKMGLYMKRTTANLNVGGNGQNVFDAYAQIADEKLVPRHLKKTLQARKAQMKAVAAKNNPSYAIRMFAGEMGYENYLYDNGIDSFRLDILRMLAEKEKTMDSFLARLDTLQQIVKEGGKSKTAYCTLSTIHSSKGLEYRRVVLADVVDGVLPADVSSKGKAERLNAEEEERRLFYVGITRAKEELVVMAVNGEESAYVRELNRKVAGTVTEKTVAKRNALELKSIDTSPYQPGEKIYHKTFGAGVITQRQNDVATIDFSTSGIRKLSIPFAVQMGFLTPG